MKLQTTLIALLVSALVDVNAHAEAPTTLKKAKEIGKSLKADGWTYGGNASAKQIDCVQFVLKALEEHYKMTFAAGTRTRILISDLKADDVINNKDGIITKSDPRTKGVQQALVDLDKGNAVSLKNAKPGDFIQYWMKNSQGKWFGHAGIIERVTDSNGTRRAFLYGSHRSTDGIGIAPSVGLRLVDAVDRRIYIVRAN